MQAGGNQQPWRFPLSVVEELSTHVFGEFASQGVPWLKMIVARGHDASGILGSGGTHRCHCLRDASVTSEGGIYGGCSSRPQPASR